MSRPRTLVLFDVDGTLIDSQSHILGAMEFAFKARGLLLPPASEILAIVGLSLSEAFAQLCPETDAQERGLLVETYKESFASLRQSAAAAPLYPGALECLEILKDLDDIVLGIATGMSRRGLSHVLSNPDLAGRFVTTQVADDHPSKPHPSMVLQAMAESGAARGVMIGDTTFDIQMG
uniref:HAD-IA family hydrolase n=1 Tax=Planktomarina sp. TaxID=2024851 RepID=UPI00325FE7D7